MNFLVEELEIRSQRVFTFQNDFSLAADFSWRKIRGEKRKKINF